MAGKQFKLTVCFESREDGGLRAWSPDLPGFVLSSRDVDGLLADVEPALKTILGYRFNTSFSVEKLASLREALEDEGVVAPRPLGEKEYVARCVRAPGARRKVPDPGAMGKIADRVGVPPVGGQGQAKHCGMVANGRGLPLHGPGRTRWQL